MYGKLATECGYTPAEIGQMTLFDLARLNRFWQKNPPLVVMVRTIASALGVEIKEQEQPAYITEQEARRLAATFDGRIPGVGSL